MRKLFLSYFLLYYINDGNKFNLLLYYLINSFENNYEVLIVIMYLKKTLPEYIYVHM